MPRIKSRILSFRRLGLVNQFIQRAAQRKDKTHIYSYTRYSIITCAYLLHINIYKFYCS
jgi:hypothetical protein